MDSFTPLLHSTLLHSTSMPIISDAEPENAASNLTSVMDSMGLSSNSELEVINDTDGNPPPDLRCPLVAELLAEKGGELRVVDGLESRVWLKEQTEAMGAAENEEGSFIELRDYIITDGNGRLASLIDIDGKESQQGRQFFIFGHLFISNLSQDTKPSNRGEVGFLGTVRVALGAWGIWWVEPKPIMYAAVLDKELGLDATLELHAPFPAYADQEEASRVAHLRRLLDIADIVLFEFAEKYPKATLTQEEARAKEEVDESVITLDSDGEDTEEDQRVVGLNRLLMERRGMSLEELKCDPAALDFIATQLAPESMTTFYKCPLIRSLLKRDAQGRLVEEGESQEPEQLLKQAPDHPLVVTPRVKQTLLRCMLDLLGDHAYGHTLKIPKVLAEAKNGAAEKIRGSGEGAQVATAKCMTTQYSAVRLFYANGTNTRLRIGDFVRTLDIDKLQFLKVLRLWQTEKGAWKCHALTLRSADNSVLGICGLPSELVYTASCATISLKYVEEVVPVNVRDAPDFEEWRKEGPNHDIVAEETKPSSYNLRFRYEDCPDDLSFSYLTSEEKSDLRAKGTLSPLLCRSCLGAEKRREDAQPQWLDKDKSGVRLCGEEFRLGETAYLEPNSLPLKYPRDRSSLEDRENIQSTVAKFVEDSEALYPESRHYQKQLEKGEFKKVFVEPFMIVRIHKVLPGRDGSPGLLLLAPLYRSTDVDFGSDAANADEAGFRRVFDCDEVIPMGLDNWAKAYKGRCWVSGVRSESEGEAWATAGFDRFYCTHRYEVRERGTLGSQIPLSDAELAALEPAAAGAPPSPQTTDLHPEQQLCSLEMFCGGGGSATGLHEAGIRTRVALDMDGEAIATMKHNNPGADVRQIDVNEFLQSSMDGKAGFPRTGDFDLIFGGPPCQGFSAMNRSPNTANSKKKNTCVTTQCGAYDFFRPSYTALENVHGLLNQKEDAHSGVEGKKTSVCNVIVAVMLDLGYQVRVYQLNAGAYGVPQCRNRVFIVGAAPGHVLPAIPRPQYASQQPPVIVAGTQARHTAPGYRGGFSAPLPELTVNDAISDLPPTTDGVSLRRAAYGSQPLTWYQKQLRGSVKEVTGHESRALSTLDRLRVEHLPASSPLLPEPDWRLLPNLAYRKGSVALKPLPYEQDGPDARIRRFICPTCPKDYHIRVKGRNAPKWKCSLPTDSLIPAGLTHKSKNNPWRDCYGRVSRHLWFRTITTGDSLNQQAGRILHPDQPRILTTRELARAQGFPDYWVPKGRISSKTRQIGNAVPPPLTKAIGFEIRKAHNLRGQNESASDEPVEIS